MPSDFTNTETPIWCGQATNSGNVYSVSNSAITSSLTDGMEIALQINVDSTGAVSLRVNGGTAHILVKFVRGLGPIQVDSGDLQANSIVCLRWIAADTAWVIVSPWSMSSSDTLASWSGTKSANYFCRGDGTMAKPTLANLDAGVLPTTVPLRFSTSNTSGTSNSHPERFINTNSMIDNVPSGWNLVNRIAGLDYFNISAALCWLGTAQTGNSAFIGFWRAVTGFVLNSSPTLHNRIQVGVTSVPAGGAWTSIASLGGVAQGLLVVLATGHGVILLSYDGTTLTKELGTSTLIVAGSAGGTEIAFRVSGGFLQASNGTGTARNVTNPACFSH